MTTLKFVTDIKAKKEKVWQVLWDDITYRKWTSVFDKTSYALSDWNEGSKIQFLTENGNGMYGIIAKKIPNQLMVFKHIGEIINGIEDSKDWENAFESYFLNETNEGTELITELEINDEFADFFTSVFPNALDIVKQLSETE